MVNYFRLVLSKDGKYGRKEGGQWNGLIEMARTGGGYNLSLFWLGYVDVVAGGGRYCRRPHPNVDEDGGHRLLETLPGVKTYSSDEGTEAVDCRASWTSF